MDTTSEINDGNDCSHRTAYLDGVVPCRFPLFATERSSEKQPFTHELEIKQVKELRSLLAMDPAEIPSVLHAIWALVVRCYTGQNDVCFGYKEMFDSEKLSGLSIVRLVLDESVSVAQTIKQARLAYGKTHRSSVLNFSVKDLCSTILSISRSSDAAGEYVSTPSSHEVSGTGLEQFDIHLEVRVSDRAINVFLHSWEHVQTYESILNIASTIDKVLSVLLSAPKTLISELSYLSDHNESQIRRFNSGNLEEVKRCIHEVIQDQVLSRPSADAVCSDDGTTLSYLSLDRLSSYLASHLQKLGVGRGTFVPLCFDKSPYNIISMLAVMKAGAAFVPLDPAVPIARLGSLSDKIQASVLLCSPQHAARLLSIVDNVIPVDGPMIDQLPAPSSSERLPDVTSTDLAYLIFTSGTTGEPKGTTIEHGAYCSGAKFHGPAMLMNSGSRVLQFAAHVFDASLVEILTTLMAGGVVYIPSEENRLNNLKMVITEMKVNWAVLTPSFVGFMDPADVPELKTLVLAGEAMSKAHIQTWSHLDLVNGYGPSECSVASVVNSRVTFDTSPSNIGLPAGVYVWVVDPQNHNNLVPIGCVGELLIQGPSVARGYHNDIEKTRESFISAPAWVSDRDHKQRKWKIYKTGDLVRQCPDGTLEFVGRKDNQVKVHGQRVELGEIEHHLIIDPDVKHGLVLLPTSGPFRGRLISVLSLSTAAELGSNHVNHLQIIEGPTLESKFIRGRLSSRLPTYMVPSVMLVVSGIPLLPSGKLDRKQVATWVETMSDELYHRAVDLADPIENRGPPNTKPATETENKLSSIWSHVLNLQPDRVELSRSFMSMGGDSISAMQVKSRCSKMGISLSVQDILRSKSIVQLAQCAKAIERVSYREEVIEQNFNLSPIQQLYFKLPNQGQGHFNQSFFLRVTRPVHKRDLRSVIENVIQRHSMLRARFSRTAPNADWQQRITEQISTSYRLKAYQIADQEQAALAIANSQACLDFERGPLFAADLFDVDGQDQLLFMVAHHLVIDLVSWRIILEEIEDFY